MELRLNSEVLSSGVLSHIVTEVPLSYTVNKARERRSLMSKLKEDSKNKRPWLGILAVAVAIIAVIAAFAVSFLVVLKGGG